MVLRRPAKLLLNNTSRGSPWSFISNPQVQAELEQKSGDNYQVMFWPKRSETIGSIFSLHCSSFARLSTRWDAKELNLRVLVFVRSLCGSSTSSPLRLSGAGET